MAVSHAFHYRTTHVLHQFVLGGIACLLLAIIGWLHTDLDKRQDQTLRHIEELAHLPKGEYVKPALLGYHHLAADMFWLRLLQVIGEKRNSADEYEWIYHALDVITTLDPHYAYAYYVGGNILGDLAKRPDLSNRLLEKGTQANPDVWYIPFLLGYNYYFLLADPSNGAEYTMKAASLPGHPSYLPGLATRLAAEAGNPDTAVAFLEARLREPQDPQTRESLANRMKEVIIERDIRMLESAVEVYRMQHRVLPATLTDIVAVRILASLPLEPFGGDYRLDSKTGKVSSSTHPERLRTFFKRTTPPMYRFPQTAPSYSFPKTWE
ncbi:MAG: hypothetical protein HP491_18320 [Nitrospira sp.]|nr:hypothetical protein [Nitrospira sp.]MBH0182651.1 hypothetical protein [Nitrospira sp.]MBH0184784.1 hypothetical protein [Nitrospira sp.]